MGSRKPSTNLKNHPIIMKVMMAGMDIRRPAKNLRLKVVWIVTRILLPDLGDHLVRDINISIDVLYIVMVFERLYKPHYLFGLFLVDRSIILGQPSYLRE